MANKIIDFIAGAIGYGDEEALVRSVELQLRQDVPLVCRRSAPQTQLSTAVSQVET